MTVIDISQPHCLPTTASLMPTHQAQPRQEKPVSATPIPLDSHDPDIALYTRDEPGPGNANHHYTASVMGEPKGCIGEDGIPYTIFQKGGKAEAGANGITNEVLLEIVRHRLACFQAGDFSCKENASALAHVEDAIGWLKRRTAKRQRRGVEGRSVK
jgi:hypothetical protein